jgi:hypothetical protein
MKDGELCPPVYFLPGGRPMRRSACVLTVLTLAVAVPAAPAQTMKGPLSSDPKIKIALELAPVLWKVIQPIIEEQILGGERGQSAEVAVLPTLRDSRLVFARKKMEVHTSHWQHNRLGEIYLDSWTECEAFYSVDLTKVKCFYYPGKKLLKVHWPGTEILTITPDLAGRRQEVKHGGWRFSPINHDIVRALEGEVPGAVKTWSAEEARRHLSSMDRDARDALFEVFQKAAQKLDPDVEVVVEPAR